MLLVHAGNRPDAADRTVPRFPEQRSAVVATQIAHVLRALAPRAVVGSASAGADLLVLAAAQQQGIPVHVVLPVGVAEFVRTSVADAGDRWVRLFHDVVATAHADSASTVVELLGNSGDWFVAANGQILDEALRLGEPGEPVVAFTVRPALGEMPPSVTDDFAARAAEAGCLVLTLDPLAATANLAVRSG